MMAAAEARAAWQRTANRCFVQEDAKRAPKLACCPSSSSTSKPLVDLGPGDAANMPEHASAGFVPLNRYPCNSNLPPDTKWWLQLQPNFGHQKDFTSEQLNILEMELESLRDAEMKRMSQLTEDLPVREEVISGISTERNALSSLVLQRRMSATCMKNYSETIAQEPSVVDCDSTQKTLPQKNTGEYWCRDKESMDVDPVEQYMSKQPEKLFDMESPWMGGEKTEPWWRTADKDELASLVAQKSLEHVENCDLPPPQIIHIRKGPFASHESFNQDGTFSSFERKKLTGLCSSVDHSRCCITCGGENRKHRGSDEKDLSYGFDKPFSSDNHSKYSKDPTDTSNTSESEPSKAELMDALRHSQTRAREAENAAQKAYDEKEHIIKLLFRQASHLFAYRQWLQLLQLETFYLQLKNKDQSISTLFPVFLPWTPYKGRQWKRGKQKPKKTKRSQPRYDIGRYVVAFAVGLGLAGAGLFLGWTMGWLFPMF
ncbi:hypothetical protein IFM89_025543 [Coptis chinensis]|uniref:Uncharacterized protein n=1 Tax=Coptis chinensis TaxID=261450 RepID=A0A835LNI8_9MAGN|nr:hypothetical protein IFM89_025543 [Coptis chinensis]